MDDNQAKELAKDFLAENVELTVHQEVPPGIYISDLNPEDVIVISFSLFEEPRFGSSKYLIVSRRDGSVRFAGHQGE